MKSSIDKPRRTLVTFIIRGDIDLDEVTENLKIHPTLTRERHRQPSEKFPYHPQDNSWRLQSPLDEVEPLEKQLEALLEVLMPAASYINQLANKQITFSCAIFEFTEQTWLDLNPTIIQQMGNLGATFSLTVYTDCNPEEADDE